jgi:hypothetical protein
MYRDCDATRAVSSEKQLKSLRDKKVARALEAQKLTWVDDSPWLLRGGTGEDRAKGSGEQNPPPLDTAWWGGRG